MFVFIFIGLLVCIPHTSIQDVSVSISDRYQHQQHPLSKREVLKRDTDAIEHLIRWLTEQQYRYEIASYALTLNNLLPNFARQFHERSEEKYVDAFVRSRQHPSNI